MWIITKLVPYGFLRANGLLQRIHLFQMLIFNENDDQIKNLSKHNHQLASQIIELMHANAHAQHSYGAVLLYTKW